MALNSLLAFIAVGALAGWLAGLLMRGGGFGLLGNVLIGIVGAFVGGWLFAFLGIAADGVVGSIVTATAGAVVLLLVVGIWKKASDSQAVNDSNCSWKTLLRRSLLLEIAGKRPARVFIAGPTLFTLAIWAAHPGVASAEADGPDFFRVVGVSVDDVLNIRAEPSPRAPKLGEIPPGADCLRNLGCRGGLTYEEFTTLDPDEQAARVRENPRWCRIEYEGINGWAAGRHLGEGGCSRVSREPEP